MLKILLIILLILVIIFNIFAFLLGTVRRFFGIAPKRKGFRTTAEKRVRQDTPQEILYKNNDVVVLRGEAKEKKTERD